MRTNQGFVLTKLLPFILLLGAVILTAFIVGQRTGWFNKATTFPQTPPIASPWQSAAKFFGQDYSGDKGYLNGNYGGLDLDTFTYESWIKLNPVDNYNPERTILYAQPPSSNYSPLHILAVKQPQGDNYTLAVYTSGKDGNRYILDGRNPFPLSSWNHFAIVKDQGELRAYINGKLDNKINMPTGIQKFPGTVFFGAREENNGVNSYSNLDGEIDELVFSRQPRYFSNFTPPTTPYPSLGKDAIWHLHLDTSTQNQYSGWYQTPNSSGSPVDLIGAVGLTPSSVPYTKPSVTPTKTPTPTPLPPTQTPTPTPIILKNLLINPSFEVAIGIQGGGWTARNIENPDRRQQAFPTNGLYTFRFNPDSLTQQESLFQVVNYPGRSNENVVLTVDSYLPSPYIKGKVGAVLIVKYTDGTTNKNSVTFKIPSATTQNKISVCSTKPYNQIKVVLFNQAVGEPTSNPYYFVDNTKLTVQPNVPTCIQPPSVLTPQELQAFN